MTTDWLNWIKEKLPNIEITLEDNAIATEKALIISPSDFLQIATLLRTSPEAKFDFLHSITGVDLKNELMAVYHLYAFSRNEKLVLKVKVSKENPLIDSVVSLWPSADWHEREAYDLLGIKFHNHPDLRRILLPDDWEGHPLRKDYKQPEFYGDLPVPAQTIDRAKRPTN